MTTSTTWAKVTHRFSGVHSWPEAAGPHAYLVHPHRHEFHVTVWVEQFHDDRDVEYLLFKDWLREMCTGGDMQGRSCEMMARSLRVSTKARWGDHRRVRVEVTEDGENGALIEE